jgi:dihydrolipoamide dehydrogenase
MTPKSLIVLGGGPGGYAAALEAAQRGLSVTLVDPSPLGGTCLHRGCIPSKFFLSQAKHATAPVAQIQRLIAGKEAVLTTLSQRMEQATKTARIERVTGTGRLVGPKTVEIADIGRREADAIILATGSSPLYPSAFPKHTSIFTSDTIFSLEYLPAHLVVVGGGYIGAELACAFQGLGSKVTLIEKEASLLATQAEFASAAPVLERALTKRGVTVWTKTEVKSAIAQGERKILLTCSNGETLEANALLLALGRRPNTESLGLVQAVAMTNSKITINANYQTSTPTIYAIGDLVSPLPLAHTASKEAELAVAHIAGENKKPLDYSRIPRVVYTWPEIASVGLTETQAQVAGHKTRVDRYHFAANSKAMVEADTEGFWLILSDAESKKILGAMIVGPQATELIHLVALALRAGLTTQEVADTVFAHPTLSEGFQEAMKRSITNPVSNVRKPQS